MTSERINWCVLVNKNTNKTYLRKKAMKRDLSNPIDEYQERVKRERETYLFFRADNNEYVFEKTIAPLGRASYDGTIPGYDVCELDEELYASFEKFSKTARKW